MQSIFEHIPLQKAHTTLLGCVDFFGVILPPQVNWKGTALLNVPGFEKKVIQYPQKETHWSTVASLLSYVINVIIPEVRQRRVANPQLIGKRFAVVLDCAPIHIADATRQAFYNDPVITKELGCLIYLPAGGTAITQPLDIAFFAGFKASLKRSHTDLVTSLLDLSRDVHRLRGYLCTTKEVRAHLVQSIALATPTHPSSSCHAAWQYSLGIIPEMPAGKGASKKDKASSISVVSIENVRAHLKIKGDEAKVIVDREKDARLHRQSVIRAAKAKHALEKETNPNAKLKIPPATVAERSHLFKGGVPPHENRTWESDDLMVEAAAENSIHYQRAQEDAAAAAEGATTAAEEEDWLDALAPVVVPPAPAGAAYNAEDDIEDDDDEDYVLDSDEEED